MSLGRRALIALLPILRTVGGTQSRSLAFSTAPAALFASSSSSLASRGGVCRTSSVSWALAFACSVPSLRSASAVRAYSSAPSSCSATMEIAQFPCLSDNYGYLLHCKETGATAAIDTPEVDPYLEQLEKKGWKLTHILNTHHQHDHAGGNLGLKSATKCHIVGPRGEASKIPGIDTPVDQGDTIKVGNLVGNVINVGGHTKGHVAYYFEKLGVAFVGDSLFAMGCGRMFEGTYDQMYASLQRLAALPDDTAIYCAHEYTQANGKFALSVEPGNEALQQRMKEVADARSKGQPTVPTTMKLEKATNPFLRWDSKEIQKGFGLEGSDGLAVFSECRKRKDTF
mmetsp:Transcript_20499/g.49388  ORF Transcript_20499/g.49388 Transcript_20499/m.49388 type:complete len:341 (-) Transcript_20499:298-1320(-)